MMLDGVAVARAACSSGVGSYDDIAQRMGVESGRKFEVAAREAWPGVERYVRMITCLEAVRICFDAGDIASSKKWRLEVLKSKGGLIGDEILKQAKQPVADGHVSEPVAKKSKAKVKVTAKSVETVVRPVVPGDVLCSAVDELVLGHAGREYRGRPVLVMKRGAVFGCPASSKSGVKVVTLRNGLLNHCDMKEPATPYWAVMDAMCDLVEFTKDQCVAHAAKSCDCAVPACSIAFDVLKGHQSHPRKRDAGMSHIVDEQETRGHYTIRARTIEETMQYFEAQRERRKTMSAPTSDAGKGRTVTVLNGTPR